ncbi:MAG: hemolysin III family protein [Oscillospiraceae bacterium]|nr:hemolysin III family protein [Oscillospiraceae bacterium]
MANTERQRDPYDGLRLWSALTHGAGAAFGILAAPFLLYQAALSHLPGAVIAMAVYLVTLIGLYTASTLYHSLRTGEKGRIRLRKIDHLNIYYLIAGSYTPFCVLALGGTLGMVMLIVIWSLAIVGTGVNLIWIHLPRWLSAGIYLAMGWVAIGAVYPLARALGVAGTFWLILGGVLYTIGGVLYAVKWPGRNNLRFGCHEIFHVFILLGSVAQFGAVWQTLAV